MPPNSFHSCIIPNLIDECSCRNEKEVIRQAKCDNILEHENFFAPPCMKQVRKTSTTYRDNYCRRKYVPAAQKICLPYPAILFSEDKITAVSTYKDDYHPYSAKDQKKYKGEAITQRNGLSCVKAKFEGKSETKFAFRCPKSKSKPLTLRNIAPSRKGVNKFGEKQAFATSTTYSSEFKKPKQSRKTVHLTPSFASKCNIAVSKEPFKHISQYRSEFKVPKVKKSSSDWCFKRPAFRPPTVPMEHMTTYKASFTFKLSESKLQPEPNPDHRCKECSRSAKNKSKQSDHGADSISNLGDGDKAERRKVYNNGSGTQCRRARAKCNKNVNMHFDKISDDSMPLEHCIKYLE